MLLIGLSVSCHAWSASQDFSWIDGATILPEEMRAELLKEPKSSMWSELVAGFNLYREECTKKPKELRDLGPGRLYEIAEEKSKRGEHCEASYVYQELMRQHPVRPHWQQAWVRQTVELIRARDYLGAINEANAFMDENPGSLQKENVHMLLLLAVYQKMISLGANKSPEWIQFGLGFQREQHLSNPFYLKLAFDSYLQEFPNGFYVDLISKFKSNARNLYAAHYFNVSKYLQSQGEYYAANINLAPILKYGPVVELFSQALFETVFNYRAFAQKIRRHEFPEQRLRSWGGGDSEGGLDAEQMAKDLELAADEIVKKMNENLPDDPWTQKARELKKQTEL